MTALSHFELGEGPRGVVLLHGFLGSGKNLRTLAQRWLERAPDHRFLVPDLRGHGTSPALAPDSDLSALAADVMDTARERGLPARPKLVGHSLGGRVALAGLRREPRWASDVVLLDITPAPIDAQATDTRRVLDLLRAAPDSAPDRRTMRAALTGQGLSGPIADWLLMNVEADDSGVYRWRIDRAALDTLHARFTGEDLWPVVEAHAAPLRAIRGGRSSYLSDADAARLHAAGVPVDTIPDAGHHLHVDALEPLVDLLTSS
jgi:pimeloyl-ACP methyl ester carboxylesterase